MLQPDRPRCDSVLESNQFLTPVRKIVGLDAVRGFAAFVVFAGHFFDGMDPAVSRRAAGTPLAGLFNGTAAVVLFFVLSGFVLTIRPIARGKISGLLPLIVKRWPRLAGTVVVASLAYIAVARIGGFPSLAVLQHLRVQGPPYVYWGQTLQDGDVGAVLAEASAGTFFLGSAQHNAVLWTMHWEFLGSFLAASLAFIVMLPLSRFVRAGLFTVMAAIGAAHSPWLLPFPLGVAGGVIHLRLGHRIRLQAPLAIAMLVASLSIWSWDIRFDTGLWSWTKAIGAEPRLLLWMAAQSAAASCLMAVALYAPFARKALGGRAGVFAGRLSFPLYLMHLLVMLSFSSWVSILLMPAAPNHLLVGALFVATFGLTLAASMPIAIFDRWWVKRVGQVTRRVLAAAGVRTTGSGS